MASRFFNPFRSVRGDADEINRLIDLISRGFETVQRALDSSKPQKAPIFAVGKGQQVSVSDAPALVTIWTTTSADGPLDSGISVSVSTGATVASGTGYVTVAPKDGQVVLSLSRGSGSAPTIVHADFTDQTRKVTF